MTATPALELIGVRAAYGRIDVLRGVDLIVPRGSVFALLGPNGAGKSTTLRVISGRMKPTAGCVHVAGVHVNGAPPAKAEVSVGVEPIACRQATLPKASTVMPLPRTKLSEMRTPTLAISALLVLAAVVSAETPPVSAWPLL